jgi:hypothetical protein
MNDIMRKNNYTKILICILPLFILLTGCQNDDSSVEKPAEKGAKFFDDLQSTLIAANNGWIMQYFATPESTGYNFFVVFDDSYEVSIGAKVKTNNISAYKEVRSKYEMTVENGPSLNFITYNEILHSYADPDLNGGSSLGGDFEFVVLELTGDLIKLRGKRSGAIISLNKLDSDISGESYITIADELKESLFSSLVSYVILNLDDKSYRLVNPASSVFEIEKEGVETDDIEKIPYITTLTGIRFQKPFEANGKIIQNFKLSDDKNSLVCTDENVNAKIEGPEIVPFFHEAIDSFAKRWTLVNEENSLSPVVKDAYDRLIEAFLSRGITLEQVSYLYSGRYSTNAVYIASKNVEGYLYFDKEVTAEGVKYTFKESFNNNGRSFYNNYDGTEDLIRLLSGSFKIEVATFKLNPSKIKLTNISDENIWFTLFLQ